MSVSTGMRKNRMPSHCHCPRRSTRKRVLRTRLGGCKDCQGRFANALPSTRSGVPRHVHSPLRHSPRCRARPGRRESGRLEDGAAHDPHAADVLHHRPRLGSRSRHGPVRGLWLRPARLGVRPDHQALLHRHHHRPGAGQPGPRLLVDSAKQVTISSKLPFQVVDATGSKHALNAGSLTVGPGYKYTDPTNLQAKPTALPYPLELRPGATALALNGRGYRGSLRVLKLSATKVRIVNVVDLDLYLRGVVPSEMPKSWAPEALKAQAVAARSYALSHLHPSNGGFDLYSDTRDQVYLGIPHEAPSTTAAVNATAGQVALYKGKVASTYFFSTSGGRTASIQDLYPDSLPVPYLVSVPDPYDTISPYHDWGPYRYTAKKLARGLKSPGKLLDVQTLAASSGRVQSVVATGSKGQATATGNEVRSALGLRSTWFQVGVLALGAPSTPLTYGTKTALRGGGSESEAEPVEPVPARRRHDCERPGSGRGRAVRPAARAGGSHRLLGHGPAAHGRDDGDDSAAGRVSLACRCQRQDDGSGTVHALARRDARDLPGEGC